MTKKNLKNEINQIKGKTIALVYIFENDKEYGMNHFFIWKSKILSHWMVAIEDLGCHILIIDVRTFVEKAMNKTLPYVDYVLNMNSGTFDLSAMALVPSTCSVLGIPCIPCSATTIIEGENKLFSNAIAKYDNLNVPAILDYSESGGVFRPINLGNSMGVKSGPIYKKEVGLYQTFIDGYDITVPLVYNPLICKLDFLPSLIYLPDNEDTAWYNDETAKKTRTGYSFNKVEICDEIKKSILKLANDINITTFCRIDARFRRKDRLAKDVPLNIENPMDFYFIEINVMPTIRPENNFSYAFSLLSQDSSFIAIVDIINELFDRCDIYMFLLVCSILYKKT